MNSKSWATTVLRIPSVIFSQSKGITIYALKKQQNLILGLVRTIKICTYGASQINKNDFAA